MKNKMIAIGLVIVLLIGMCNYDKHFVEVAKAKSMEEQIKIITANKKLWIETNTDLSPWDMHYAVTDLNQDGRLELIVTTGSIGSGHFTFTDFYQVDPEQESLISCKAFHTPDYALPDLYVEHCNVYIDASKNTYQYLFYDYINGGMGKVGKDQIFLTISDNSININSIRGTYGVFNAKKNKRMVKNYYKYVKGKQKDTTKKGYKKAMKDAIKNKTCKKASFTWVRLKKKDKDYTKKLIKSYEGFLLS